MKEKWYLQPWILCICFAFWFFVVPGIIGVVLLILNIMQSIENRKIFNSKQKLINDIGAERYIEVTEKIRKIESDFEGQKQSYINEISNLQNHRDIEKIRIIHEIENENARASIELVNKKNDIANKESTITQLNFEIERLDLENEKSKNQSRNQIKKLARVTELYKGINYTLSNFFNYIPTDTILKISANDLDEIESISPSIMLKLHCMDIKDLRKAYNENNKLINNILSQYSDRYTTKANRTIYQLMVLALRAELQNILYNLKYEKLDKSVEDVKTFTSKYLKIAADGNQSIAGTLTKFIGEVEYLFISAVKIEYNYYVKKEQAKQEQLAIRQQMREEAEERKILAQQQKQIEKEEEKYNNEIAKIQELLIDTQDDRKIAELNARILTLQVQLSDVVIKKDEIIKLQNGKAGNVYVISNLGSFGENIFKIGMTRRIDPQERIDELGSASVPFRFDVHSFIFSDDAVDLEKRLHSVLNEKRVNKVNLRKEFFNTTIDELEDLVVNMQPTAEFNRTMIAEEFNQSLSGDGLYDSSINGLYDEDEDEEEILEVGKY
ncbi:MAG: GIY-YIG nuclease family protein [Mobilitalea sp.]